jgi:hypothetical protein
MLLVSRLLAAVSLGLFDGPPKVLCGFSLHALTSNNNHIAASNRTPFLFMLYQR